ncbi:MAG: tetratricopeptide repeat protein [Gammaproteobacteria bacterium]
MKLKTPHLIGWTALCCLSLSGCASGTAEADATKSSSSAADLAAVGEVDASPGSVEYYLLLAETARQKQLFDIAAENYLKAARMSDDPAVAKRSTEVSFELGRDEEALASALRWESLDKNDEYPQVHSYLARLYTRFGKTKKVVTNLRALLKSSDGDLGDSLLALSTVLSDEENTDVALDAYKKVATKYKRNPQAHYAVGLQALRSGEFDQAIVSAKRATELDDAWGPGHLLYARSLMANGEVDAGIDYAGEHIGGTNTPGERLEYGMLLAAVDRDIEASVVLEQVLMDDPSSGQAARALGILALKAGELELADRYFTQLLQSGQSTYDALYYLGGIAESNENERRAYRLYSEVRGGDNVVTAQLRAAYILFRQEKIDEALQHLERFAAQAPRYTKEMALGQGEILARGDRADEALMLYDNMLEQDPEDSRTQYARAFLLEQLDRVDEAIHQMRLILAQDPTDPTALNALGYTLADRTDQLDEAYELIKLAFEKSPESGPIADSMGWVEFRRGNLEHADELLTKAFDLLPDGEVAAHLLEVLYTRGETTRLQELLDTVAEDFEGDERIEEVRQRLGL